MSSKNDIADFLEQLDAGKATGSSVYFLGIGGIGMSAIARYFNSRGVKISGYDKTETLLTKQLQSEGMDIHYTDDIGLIDTSAVMVVYTPAVPADHGEYNYFLQHGYPLMKRSEVLGLITKSSFNICVAGTHGKTTTSTMIAHILRHSGFGCNAFLGGIASNYNSNFWSSPKNVSVAEADEYDRSFLRLNPDLAVITAMDPDHLDIYGNTEKFREAFVEFTQKIKPGGLLISRAGLEKENEFTCSKHWTYSLEKSGADIWAENIRMQDGSYTFDVSINNKAINDIVLHMGGLHNVENAIAAIAAAKYTGIEDDKIKSAVEAFAGVKRRFEYIIKRPGFVMIDDYAHHPQELSALISGAKKLFPDKKCTVVFQPHLYSRTKDFADGFAASLNMADEVFLLPVYPAREKPMPGVNSEMIAAKMNIKVTCCSKEELIEKISHQKNEMNLLITSGAGDIDTMVDPLRKLFL